MFGVGRRVPPETTRQSVVKVDWVSVIVGDECKDGCGSRSESKVGTVSLAGAQARVEAGDVSEVSWLTWDVAGDPERGDSLAFYLVSFNTSVNSYQCGCQSSMVGERRVCEHIVAVIIYRGAYGDKNVGGEENPDHVPEHQETDNTTVRVADSRPSVVGMVTSPNSTEWGVPPFPEWVSEFRGHQWDAAVAIVEAFNQGSRVVFLDAPTGSGKTLIAEMVRRLLDTKALYLCSDKQLQDQFAGDFGYSVMLKGRSNYPTLNETANENGITAGDCDKHTGEDDVKTCSYCLTRTYDCPYEVAKREALAADLAVLNSTYFLTEAKNVGMFAKVKGDDGKNRRRPFVIVDECDVLESELMRFIEFYVGEGTLKRLRVTAPKKGSHHKTIADWLVEEYAAACEGELRRIPKDTTNISERKRRNTLKRNAAEAVAAAGELLEAGELDEGVLWVRDNDAGPLSLKPVRVDRQTPRYLWNYADKWLCMSATIISGDVEAQSLGLNAASIPWTVVKVPMTFDVAARPIYAAPAADMSWKGRSEGGWDDCVKAIRGILRRHGEERILIHAVSYKLATFLQEQLANTGRTVLSYRNAGERTATLATFRQSAGAVLIAPSMERGVDLKGDDCRVVIVAKVPYPYVQDKAVGARMHQGRDGDVWYAVQTIRALVQMTGRAVRSQEDWCETYIVDSNFLTGLHSKWKHLLPGWWLEAMSIINARSLLREGE